MKRIQLKQVDEISRKKIPDAYNSFMRQCKLKNLSPYSYLYYEMNISFFLGTLPDSSYVHLKVPSQKHKKSRFSKLVTGSGPQGISFCFYFCTY